MRSPRDTKTVSILKSKSIREAIKVLNDGHLRIVLVLEEKGQLAGVLADSDVRRAILAGKSLDIPVTEIMKSNPVFVKSNTSDEVILKTMMKTKCFELPVIDSNGFPIDVVLIQDLLEQEASEKPIALVMAGGLGSRLLPLTENKPKPLIEVGGQPILFSLLDQLIQHGIESIFVSVNYKADQIVTAIEKEGRFNGFVQFLHESEPLGTAGSLSLLPNLGNRPIVLANADLVTTANLDSLFRHHASEGNDITIATKTETLSIPFGVIQMQDEQVVSIDEKPNYSFQVSAGLYILESNIANLVEKNTKCDMPALVNLACKKGQKVGSFALFEYWKDVGELHSLEQANADARALQTLRKGLKN